MEERKFDGTSHMTEAAEMDAIRRAIGDPTNEQVVLYLPGSKVERWVNGKRRRFMVSTDGRLVPETPERKLEEKEEG